MEQKLVVAADFGNGKVAVAAAFKNEQNQIEMIDFRSKSGENLISDGKIVDETALTREVSAMIQQIERDNNLQIDKVHFAVAPHTLRSEIRKVNTETNDPLTDINEELIDKAEEIEISYSRCVFGAVPLEITTVGNSKAEGNFLIISSQNAVQQQFKNLENSVLSAYKPKCFVAPLIEAEQFLNSGQKKNGALLVDIGLGCTSFAVYQGGLPRLCAVLPLGSKHITGDIMKTFNVGKNNAEALKTDPKFGLATTKNLTIGTVSIKADELKMVISARLNEIFKFIFDEIKNQKLETVREIVLVGGGSKMIFLPEYLKKISGAEVKIANFDVVTNSKTENFICSQNALLFALLRHCDETCGKVKQVKEVEMVVPPKETEKERRERERKEAKEKKKIDKEAERERKKNLLQRTIDFLEEKIGSVKEEGIFADETLLDGNSKINEEN